MKKILSVALAVLELSVYNSELKFKVEGEISGAGGKMLYLEASALEGIVPLDSIRLEGNGMFASKQIYLASPEFYRLWVDDKVINFSIDSTETVRLDALCVDLFAVYTVEGSANSVKIKELTLKQTQLQDNVNALIRSMQVCQVGADVFEDSLTALMKSYKGKVKIDYILAAPDTTSAYFALFQKLNNYLIFDPLNNKDDVRCFAAVTTSLSNYYPHADRLKNLYNIIIKGMKDTYAPQQKVMEPSAGIVSEIDIIDINLRGMESNMHKPSGLKGRVVILDFVIYRNAVSPTRNYVLRDLYDKYATQGLEIYRVSLNADEHYWKTTADNLPWVHVRDASGVHSSVAAVYNVRSLPAVFPINRKSELSVCGEIIKDLDAAMKALL